MSLSWAQRGFGAIKVMRCVGRPSNRLNEDPSGYLGEGQIFLACSGARRALTEWVTNRSRAGMCMVSGKTRGRDRND